MSQAQNVSKEFVNQIENELSKLKNVAYFKNSSFIRNGKLYQTIRIEFADGSELRLNVDSKEENAILPSGTITNYDKSF